MCAAPHVWQKKQHERRVYPSAQNFVKYIAFNHCADPFPLLVETFIPAFLQLWVSLSIWDLEDVALERLRSYPRYSPSGTAKRGSNHLSRKGTKTEPLHRRVLAGYEGVKHPYAKTLTTFLFYLTGPLEKIGFAMLLYGASDRFFYNWTYLLKQRRYCTSDPNAGPFQRKLSSDVVLFNMGESPLALPDLIQNRAGWTNSAFNITVPGTRRYQVILTGEFRSFADTLPGCILRINFTALSITWLVADSEPTELNSRDFTPMMVQAQFDASLLVNVNIDWMTFNPLAPVGVADARNCLITIYAIV